ncbi:hypothetical protein, partial [Streptomyces sp. C]|uniref:hypothetical protein n=1 Tax=Streptomyces sp. C TaxID=253839 RepID=UPI0001B53698
MTPVRRRTAVRLLALALCPLPALAGCTDPAPAAPPDATDAAVRRAVADWSAAQTKRGSPG